MVVSLTYRDGPLRCPCEMQASLTLFAKGLFNSRSLFLPTALAILSVALAACGSGDNTETLSEVNTSRVTTSDAVNEPAPTSAPAQQPASASAATAALPATVAPQPTEAPTATVAPTETPEPTPEPPYWTQIDIRDAIEKYPPLNERTDYALRNTQEWLNGEPTSIKELQDAGQIVLIDFWTYT